jgi:hypothetical protein
MYKSRSGMTRFVHLHVFREAYGHAKATELGGHKSKFSRLPFYGYVKKPAWVLQP